MEYLVVSMMKCSVHMKMMFPANYALFFLTVLHFVFCFFCFFLFFLFFFFVFYCLNSFCLSVSLSFIHLFSIDGKLKF